MIVTESPTLRPRASAGHALTFEEADPGMLKPLATATTFDIILMLHEDADGLAGSVSTSRISSAQRHRTICFKIFRRCSNRC